MMADHETFSFDRIEPYAYGRLRRETTFYSNRASSAGEFYCAKRGQLVELRRCSDLPGAPNTDLIIVSPIGLTNCSLLSNDQIERGSNCFYHKLSALESLAIINADDQLNLAQQNDDQQDEPQN